MYWLDLVSGGFRFHWLANHFFFPEYAVGFVLLSILRLPRGPRPVGRQARHGPETLLVLCIVEIRASGCPG